MIVWEDGLPRSDSRTATCAVALLVSYQVLSESHTPRQQQLNVAAQLGRATARPIAKRIRWFVDGHDGMLSELDQTFMFDTHADIVDGVFPCCGFGGVNLS
jgi:hypothetical protein